jgi:hypothetical protein
MYRGVLPVHCTVTNNIDLLLLEKRQRKGINMALKKLNSFLAFDWLAFSKGKTFMVVGIGNWVEFGTGNILGKKFELVILEDKTDYGVVADGEVISNQFEKLTVKVAGDFEANVSINSHVTLDGVVATVYGDYRNMLSIKASSIVPVKK